MGTEHQLCRDWTDQLLEGKLTEVEAAPLLDKVMACNSCYQSYQIDAAIKNQIATRVVVLDEPEGLRSSIQALVTS
jgi:hypothetical protein